MPSKHLFSNYSKMPGLDQSIILLFCSFLLETPSHIFIFSYALGMYHLHLSEICAINQSIIQFQNDTIFNETFFCKIVVSKQFSLYSTCSKQATKYFYSYNLFLLIYETEPPNIKCKLFILCYLGWNKNNSSTSRLQCCWFKNIL